MTGLAPTHRIFKRHSTSPAASRRSASEPPRVTLVPAPSARNDPGLTPGAAASDQTQSHDSPARRRRMGREARNPSQILDLRPAPYRGEPIRGRRQQVLEPDRILPDLTVGNMRREKNRNGRP